MGDLLYVDTDNIPTSYSYQVVNANGTVFSPGGYPLSFGSKSSTTVQIPNLPSGTVIVPAGVTYRLWIGASILVGTKVTTRSISTSVQQTLVAGTRTEFNVLGATLDYNLVLVETAISDTSQRIVSMETQGFYVVREKGKLAHAEVNYVAAVQHYGAGEYTDAFDSAKTSYIDARSTLGDLNNLAMNQHIVLLFLVEALLQGLVGGIIGYVIGVVAALITTGGTTGYDILLKVPAVESFTLFATSLTLAVVLSTAATIYPAYRESKLDPVEALRYEL